MCLLSLKSVGLKSVFFRKLLLVLIMCISILMFYNLFVYTNSDNIDSHNFRESSGSIVSENLLQFDYTIINTYYKARESWSTSNLGSILFKNFPKEVFQRRDRENKTFLILIWKHWKWLQSRHVYSFKSSGESDLLSQCSVKNCIFSGNDTLLNVADAVVIHIQRGQVPSTESRRQNQRWIFLNDESPKNAFSLSKKWPKLSELANLFNWSMTYRSDADVPVPYGRTVPLTKLMPLEVPDVIPNWINKRRDVLAAVLISNCGVSYRMQYLKDLKRYIEVDVHGKCSENNKQSCPGHFRSDCGLMSEYLFYLVFENSMCKEYLTEKSFYHAYSKGAIPVIMGPSMEDCEKILPPNSYLHVENFKSAEALANTMIRISKDTEELLSFHHWRNSFAVVNEHGYFKSKSFHLCRVCEALNYNDETEKIYSENDLKEFLDPIRTCREIRMV